MSGHGGEEDGRKRGRRDGRKGEEGWEDVYDEYTVRTKSWAEICDRGGSKCFRDGKLGSEGADKEGTATYQRPIAAKGVERGKSVGRGHCVHVDEVSSVSIQSLDSDFFEGGIY